MKTIYRNPDWRFTHLQHKKEYVSDWPCVLVIVDGVVVDPQGFIEFSEEGYVTDINNTRSAAAVEILLYNSLRCVPCVQKMRNFDWRQPGAYFNSIRNSPEIMSDALLHQYHSLRAKHQTELDHKKRGAAHESS